METANIINLIVIVMTDEKKEENYQGAGTLLVVQEHLFEVTERLSG